MPLLLAVDWTAISAVATAAASLGTLAVVVVAVLQRNDARESAEAAHRAAVAAERSVEVQIAANAEQSRLATYPALAVRFVREETTVRMVLENPSSVPALDLHVIALMVLWVAPKDFADQWAAPAHYAEVASAAPSEDDADGGWSIRDWFWTPQMPARKALDAELSFPIPADYLTVLLQFRDMLGRNYLHLFYVSWSADQNRYSVAAEFEGDRIQEGPRLEVNGNRLTSATPLPEFVQRNFVGLYEHSISAICLRSGHREAEDRGTWSDLA